MVNRIGAQVADVRRNIDRLWEDQSIETCDDWVIPYIGALLGTDLVSGLDARGQRHRRRQDDLLPAPQGHGRRSSRKSPRDITGWDAKVVEFFRRLGRTRHGLTRRSAPRCSATAMSRGCSEPRGWSGPLTHTGIGGFADLRNVYGASKAGVRVRRIFPHRRLAQAARRQRLVQHPASRRLSVAAEQLWRRPGDAGGGDGCPGWFTFDPTGRDVPLFAASRTRTVCEAWSSPDAAEVAGPITQTLFDTSLESANTQDALYPQPVAVYSPFPPPVETVPIAPTARVAIRPERGRFKILPGTANLYPAPYWASYNYGFSSAIGAGPSDRRLDALSIATPAPLSAVSGGGLALSALTLTGGTVTIGDSQTYTAVADLSVNGGLTLRATNQMRPVLRLSSDWTIGGAAGTLSLDGLWIAGADLILAGSFAQVTISCCTLDPGNTPAAVAPGASSPPRVSPASPPGATFARGRRRRSGADAHLGRG